MGRVVDPLWAGLAVAIAGLAVWPALRYRSATRTAPWALTAVAVGPPLVRAVGVERTVGVLADGVAWVGLAPGPAALESLHSGLALVAGLGEGIALATAALLVVAQVQATLLAITAVGVRTGRTSVVANAAGGLAVTLVPAVLRRRRGLTVHPGLALWIGLAVLLHTAGTLGLYASFSWYDTITHGFSAAVVAAVGYSLARALDVRQECLSLPPRFLFVYLLLFVLAAGVVWEVFEYLVTLAAVAVGLPSPLIQPNLADTMTDLAFDVVGGLLVAVVGTLYLDDGLIGFAGPRTPTAE